MSDHRKAQAEREANVVWQGNLQDGQGMILDVTSAAFANLPVSWASRSQNPDGQTSPEELLAAAHAACYAMALSHELAGRNAPPQQLEVRARVGFDPKVGGGFEVSFSRLTVHAQVEGITPEQFDEAARQAAEGCPISAAMKGNVEITVRPTLT
ncbi:MAG: OsmC family peroxiredoxin [Thermomicrobiales bacterium]|nr:OsmC family peroxiredoxin [Thermomicrobiales bacterium]